MLFQLSYRQEIDGVTDRVRTGDLAGHNRALCQLSYGHHKLWRFVGDSNPWLPARQAGTLTAELTKQLKLASPAGLEPATPGFVDRCSSS